MKRFTGLFCYALLVLIFIAFLLGWKMLKQRDCLMVGHSSIYCLLRR